MVDASPAIKLKFDEIHRSVIYKQLFVNNLYVRCYVKVTILLNPIRFNRNSIIFTSMLKTNIIY